jgi:hypothetical protein
MSSFLSAACCARVSSAGGAVGGEAEGTGVLPPRERRVVTMAVVVVEVLGSLEGRREERKRGRG